MGTTPIERVVLDPYRELADADRTNNVFPPEIMLGRFKVEPRSRRSNPMQAARERDGREDAMQAARRIGVALMPAYDAIAEDGDTPLSVSSRLIDAVGLEVPVDVWGRPMRLEFSADPAFEFGTTDVFASLRSDGRDGERGTEDDVSISILADGRVYEEGLEPTFEEPMNR